MKKLVGGIAVVAVVGIIVAASWAVRTQGSISADPNAKTFFDYSAATGNIEPVGEPIPVTPKLLEHGKWVFRGMCNGCHGEKGDGNGAVWELGDTYAAEHKLPRKPRDFTQAVFKIRSTPSGSFPTDVDLFKSISRGLVADQDMPAFKFLPERDRWAVIAYIKTFSDLWEEEAEYQEDPITIGEPPIPDARMLAAGKEVYAKMKCAECHGERGLGDGSSAPELEDDNGLPIVPRNFTDATQFVGGSDPKSIFQTFNTGFDGTPMPSFLDFLDEEQSWRLVWYVISLRPEFNLVETRREMLAAHGEDIALADAPEALSETPIPPPQQAAAPEQEAPVSTQATADETTQIASTTVETTEPAATETPIETTAETAESDASTPNFIGDYKEKEVSDGGIIQGKITYTGSVKKRTVLPTKDKQACGKKRKEPMILVGDDDGVQDSVIFLKSIKEGKAWSEDMATKKPILDQEGCRFEPHVQVARQGDIDIVNSDPVLHNTHGYYGKRTAFNIALPEQNQRITKTLKRAGTVKVDCDAHGWMLGWVQVVDNPYFAQTGADGVFTISDIPPGEYTMVVWQEWLGETEMQVTVNAGETTELNVELKQ